MKESFSIVLFYEAGIFLRCPKFWHNLQFHTKYDILSMLYMFVIGQTFIQTTVIVNYNAYE